jgi:nucleoside-diphosphate-sugar epimerase
MDEWRRFRHDAPDFSGEVQAVRVAVTGGTGFVGSHSVKALIDEGHTVNLLVRSPGRIRPALDPLGVGEVDHVTGDVTDVPSIERALEGCDAVLHAASVFSLDPRQAKAIRSINVAGTESVIATGRRLGLDPIVHVSSYGAQMGQVGAVLGPDSPPTHPRGVYVSSKAESDRVARRHQDEGAPVVITYPGGVYGPHDPHWGESAQIVSNALHGFYRFMPRGRLAISDARDIARLHAAVMAQGKGPRRYMGTAVALDGPALIALLSSLTGRKLRTTQIPFGAVYYPLILLDALNRLLPFRFPLNAEATWILGRAHTIDDSRTREEFGIEPRPVEQTLEEMIRWMVSTGRLKPKLAGKLAE